MQVYYHSDADGKCSAYIVKAELCNVFDKPLPEDFYMYSYTGEIGNIIKNDETVYIVDLSLNDVIYYLIYRLIANGCKVIHIDHHKTTLDYLDSCTPKQLTTMNSVTKFYKVGISGCLLTWIYSCMNDTERENPMSVSFDFAEGRSHVKIIDSNNDAREYRIPMAIRYIDDYDVWRHDIEESNYFIMAYNMLGDNSPSSLIWDDLIYGSDFNLKQYVDNGRLIYDYQMSVNKDILKNAFEVEFTKIGTVLCLNSIYGNSKIFGDKFDEYVAVCKFGYDGTHDKWVYSMYASEVFNKDNDVDLTPIAKFFGGGGHKHACGWTLSFNIFDRRSNVPYNHEPFITDMQKIDWGSYDEY